MYRGLFRCCLLALLSLSLAAAETATRPNVIFILTDDMGRGDLSCLGGKQGITPNIDRLAKEGTIFNRFYVAAPICSPSRAAFTTGSFPGRWRITNFLHQHKGNLDSDQADFLDPKAPTVARTFQAAGYATAHFGKWHMGGGRDVQNAPLPQAYGFAESHVNCEGMGPRFEDWGLGTKPVLNSEDGKSYLRCDFTRYWVDRSVDFIKRHQGTPFYLELWPQDVHTPWSPSDEALKRTEEPGLPNDQQRFRAVLNEYDAQLGRFLRLIHEMGLDENTVVIFSSDNGPMPSFDHARTLDKRGMKLSLYEGGIHVPFFVRWPGHIPAGKVNDTAVLGSVDYLPTICALAGVQPPSNAVLDGLDQSRVWLGGESTPRTTPLFWEYGRKLTKPPFTFAEGNDRSPPLAMRDGDWKLLINADGTDTQLYNIATDAQETTNVASQNPEITARMSKQTLAWRQSLP